SDVATPDRSRGARKRSTGGERRTNRMSLPTDAADLTRLLSGHGIDTSQWRHPDANTVDDLLRELKRGECRLLDEPLRREVTIVRICIRRGDLVLIETELIETPGRRQARNRMPSEKMLPGEDPAAAARRGIREELAAGDERIAIVHVAEPFLQSGPG